MIAVPEKAPRTALAEGHRRRRDMERENDRLRAIVEVALDISAELDCSPRLRVFTLTRLRAAIAAWREAQ